MVKILGILTTLNDPPFQTIESLLKQTVPPSDVYVVVGSPRLYRKCIKSKYAKQVHFRLEIPDMREPLGVRLAKAINNVLSQLNLDEYDYILKLDADIVLPPNFLEENIKINADYVGKAGYNMLLKVPTFLKLFSGRWVEKAAEDTHMGLKLLCHGYKVEKCVVKAFHQPYSKRKHDFKYYFDVGVELYKLGYEPIHVLAELRGGLREIFHMPGYIYAFIRRYKRYYFAPIVTKLQVMRLIYGKRPAVLK